MTHVPERLRVALLTPEYPIETRYGGLARYLRRIAIALRDEGHEPEVFVVSESAARTVIQDGVTVHFCPPAPAQVPVVQRLIAKVAQLADVGDAVYAIRGSRSLAAALAARDEICPFNFVQSSDYMAAGLFVSRRAGRPHLVRASWARDLFNRVDRRSRFGRSVMAALERKCITKADAAYAPSEFVAKHLAAKYNHPVAVIRPPALLEMEPASEPPANLPARFLVHVARLGTRKGSDLLAAALPLVWQEAPDFSMVWIGDEMYPGTFARYAEAWGSQAARIDYRGGLDTAPMFAVVRRAEASVVPSVVDNLPNTAIESLLLDVPVIGTRGSSLDELILHERTGLLCSSADPSDLAGALLRVWQGRVPWTREDFSTADQMQGMNPAIAIASLIEFARRAGMSTSVQMTGRI